MMLLYLCSIWGLAWIIKESDVLATPRQWICQRSVVITRLLWCWYCVGFWAGVAIYLLQVSASSFDSFSPFEWLIWGCAGSAFSAFGNAVMQRLEFRAMSIPSDIETKEQEEKHNDQ